MSNDLLEILEQVASDGARTITMVSDDELVPVLLIVDDDEEIHIAGWMLEEVPSKDPDTLCAVLIREHAQMAAYIAEISMVMSFGKFTDPSAQMIMVDGALVITADAETTRTRVFVIDRALPLGDPRRFIASPIEGVGGIDCSWLQKALASIL